MSDGKSALQALAMAMLKRSPLFDHDIVSAETMWRQQAPETRAAWRRRAHEVLDDLAADGYVIKEV